MRQVQGALGPAQVTRVEKKAGVRDTHSTLQYFCVILLCPIFMEEEPGGQGLAGGGHLGVSRQEMYHCSGWWVEDGKAGRLASEEEGPRVRRKSSAGEQGHGAKEPSSVQGI